jgi:hypothetical protein
LPQINKTNKDSLRARDLLLWAKKYLLALKENLDFLIAKKLPVLGARIEVPHPGGQGQED